MVEPLENLPYRLRYMNGKVSVGGFKTFDAAVKCFFECRDDFTGTLFKDLKDVVCIERNKDYLEI